MFVFSSEYMLAKSVLFCVHELLLMQMTRYMACTVSATWLPDPPCAHGLTDQPALRFFPGLTFPLWEEMRQISHQWGKHFSRLRDDVGCVSSHPLALD